MSVLADPKPLTAAELGAVLTEARVLVVGVGVREQADELVRQEPFRGLKVKTDERREPNAWEVY